MPVVNQDRRAVIVDTEGATVELVGSLLTHARGFSMYRAGDAAAAWALFGEAAPALVLIAHEQPRRDAVRLTRALRRSELAARQAPVIVLVREATASQILAARDAGAHEVLAKPFTLKDLVQRVDAVMDKPRDWVEGMGYVGPDRRRFNSGAFAGPRKRGQDAATTPERARIGQALKIMKSAIEGIDAEPRQALRALRAQVDALNDAALALEDFPLAAAAQTLKIHLETAADRGRFNSRELAADIGGMFGIEAAGAGRERVRA
jgi:two-component system, response regulator PdtaR